MNAMFSKEEILKLALSSHDDYCVGYPGQGNYTIGLVMGVGSFEKTFSHSGSATLDKIVAYDRAEVSGAYIGQINMSMVSSFCGPQGLIWGYDLAKKDDIQLPAFLPTFKENEKKLAGIKLRNGENWRKATAALFGTKERKNFPFLPGSHVPCAGRYCIKSGPTILYGAIAIGIPENRNRSACLLMEDIGEITVSEGVITPIKQKLMMNAVKSIIEIGKNQSIKYQEIFVDFISKKVKSNEIGCVLVAMPYFLLAKKAFNKNIIEQNLEEWIKESQPHFLDQ